MSAHHPLKLEKDKTELSWIGAEKNALTAESWCSTDSRRWSYRRDQQSSRSLCSHHVRSVTWQACLCCQWQLLLSVAQMRRFRRWLDNESLVQAFVTTRVDYCNWLLAGPPKTTTDKLKHVTNAAVPVMTNTRKFDRGLTQLRRQDLHWLDVTDRIKYRQCVNVYKCLHIMAPEDLSDLCTPRTSKVPGRQHLRSADSGEPHTLRFRLTTFGGRPFACVAPSTWNSLTDSLKDTVLSLSSFQKQLKIFLLFSYSTLAHPSTLEVAGDSVLY